MSLDIHGWVEITRQDAPGRSDEYAWEGLVNIGALIDAPDQISEKLFGFSKAVVSGEKSVHALAANRGFPANPSKQVRGELEAIRRLEERVGKGEVGGFTFALWHEISEAGIDDSALGQSDWRLLFDLIERLEQDERLSGERIRLVMYYVW